MAAESEQLTVTAPLSSGVIQLDVTTTAQRFVIPTSFAGCNAIFSGRADAGPSSPIGIGVLFGDSTVTAAIADSTVSTGNITLGATTPAVMTSDGDRLRWVIPSANLATHFSVIGTSDGKLTIQKG